MNLPPNVEYPSGHGLPSPKLNGCTNVSVFAAFVFNFSHTYPFLVPQFPSKYRFKFTHLNILKNKSLPFQKP